MGNLVLDSLEIKNFRAFRHLEIKRLGRVNLITGKNNVGKTALLEALWLYAMNGSTTILRRIMTMRDELKIDSSITQIVSSRVLEENLVIDNFKYLFYGRRDIREVDSPIMIGPSEGGSLAISLQWLEEVIENDKDDPELVRTRLIPASLEDIGTKDVVPYLRATNKDNTLWRLSLERIFARSSMLRADNKGIPNQYITSSGLDVTQMGGLWDAIALTPLEDDVLNALKMITQEAERINFIGGREERRGQMPIIKMQNIGQPIPMKSLGEGMTRLFGIMLALVNAKDGFLLIDEVENGLHYSVQPDIWRMIFTLAQRLNVQVFATTHSWDCIEAFQQAACENKEEEGVLIRLQRKGDEIRVTEFDERRLSIAARDQIEVR